MKIRYEIEEDCFAIHAVNVGAFERVDEANLVDTLRSTVRPLISLVAEEQDTIIGHVLFSPIELPKFPELKIMALAPVAVVPEKQKSGVGSSLIQAGLDECRKLEYGAVTVLGDPTYYKRFSFIRAKEFGIQCEFARNDESFMLIELMQGYLNGATGTVKYADAFSAV